MSGFHRPRVGFTLIELLVVIAIIAILAAILFPVFARAREKARQTTCSSNQRQIVASVQMYAQDHDETFPFSANIWQSIAVDPGVLVCPTQGKNVANGYCYVYALSGATIGGITDPTASPVTVDAVGAVWPNTLVQPTEVQMVHSNQCIASFVDGHVATMSDQYALFPIVKIGELDAVASNKTTIVYNPALVGTGKPLANIASIAGATGTVQYPNIGTGGLEIFGTGASGSPTMDESNMPATTVAFPAYYNAINWTQGWKLNGGQSHFVLNNGTADQTGQMYPTTCSPTVFQTIKLSTKDYKPFFVTIVEGKYDWNGGSIQVGYTSNPNAPVPNGLKLMGSCAYGAAAVENYAVASVYQFSSPGCPIYFYFRNNSIGYNQNREFGITGIFYN